MLDFKGKVDEYIAKFGKPWQCGKKPADLAREYGYPFEEYEHKVQFYFVYRKIHLFILHCNFPCAFPCLNVHVVSFFFFFEN